MIKGIVYKLKCNKTGLFYIGSTTQKITYRLYTHKGKYNLTSTNKILDNNDYFYKILDERIFNSLKDLRALENLYIAISKNKFSDININKRYGLMNDNMYKIRRSELNTRKIKCCECNKIISFKSKYKHNKIYHNGDNVDIEII